MYHLVGQNLQKDSHLNWGVHELGSFVEGSRNPMTQTCTPKFVEEVVIEVMKANKVVKLFQIMEIMSLNMGNLTIKVNILKNRLIIGEKEKAMLQEEFDKEREFQKGYSIMWRSRGRIKQRLNQKKKLIKKL